MSDIRVRHSDLVEFFAAGYAKTGIAPADARKIASILAEVELRGIATHGAIRFPFYIRRLQQGGLNPKANMRLESDYPASAVLDADHAPGQLAGTRGMELAIEKARTCGVGFVAVKNSDHFGASGSYAMQAAEQDMIGMVWSNGFSVMAAWGGFGNSITNAPLAYAIPAGTHEPILLDVSFSAVAGGKVRLAAKKGETIPKDWVLDKHGKFTDDPNDLPDGGSLLAAAGHKGYGLAVVCEVLNGVLTGSPFLTDIPLWFANPTVHSRTAHTFLALDISKFRDLGQFKADVDQVIDRLKATPTMEGVDEVLVPGEIEQRRTAAYLRDGIPISEPVVADLVSLGKELGIPVPADWE